jgi:hypothetical protein
MLSLQRHHQMSYSLAPNPRESLHAYRATELLASNPAQPLSVRGSLYSLLRRSQRLIMLQYRRCSASTCAICVRVCTGDPVPGSRWTGPSGSPSDSSPSTLSRSNVNASSLCRRRRRDEDSDNVLKTNHADNRRSGCGQTVCRICCYENPQRLVSILNA